MLFISSSGGIVVFSGDGARSTETFTLTFSRLSEDVLVLAVTNTSLYPERYYQFTLLASEIEILTGQGEVRLTHVDDSETIRTDLYTLIEIEE